MSSNINDMIDRIVNSDDNKDENNINKPILNDFNESSEDYIQKHIQTLINPVYVPNSPNINNKNDTSPPQTNDISNNTPNIDERWEDLFTSYVKMKGIKLNEDGGGENTQDRVDRIKGKIKDDKGKKLKLHKSDFIYYCNMCSSHNEVMKSLELTKETYYKYMNKFTYPLNPKVKGIYIENTHQYNEKVRENKYFDNKTISLREYYSIKWYGYNNIFDVKNNVHKYGDGDHYSGPKTYDSMINLYFPEYLKERKEELRKLYERGDWDKLNDENVVGTYEILRRNHMKDVFTGKVSGSSQKKVQQWVLDYDILPKKCNSCGYNHHKLDERSGEEIYPLILNFIDDNEKNCTLTNLELLCYNCYFIKIPYNPMKNHWKYRWKPLSTVEMQVRSIKLNKLKDKMYRRNKWINNMSRRLYQEDFITLEMKWNNTTNYDENGLGLKHPELDRLARKMMNDMMYYS